MYNIMDINNIIKINDIVSRYNKNKQRYGEIMETLLEMKDKISDLELERNELFDTLTQIRLEEVNFLNELKNDHPDEYMELMVHINKSALGLEDSDGDDK